jgi:hypothetical protein
VLGPVGKWEAKKSPAVGFFGVAQSPESPLSRTTKL